MKYPIGLKDTHASEIRTGPIPRCVLCNCWLFTDEPSYEYKDSFVGGKAHRECTPESVAKEALDYMIAEVVAPPMTETAKRAYDGTMGVVGMLSRKWGTEPNAINLEGWDVEAKKAPWRYAEIFNDVTKSATAESRVLLGLFGLIVGQLQNPAAGLQSTARPLMPARPAGGVLSDEAASAEALRRPEGSQVLPEAPGTRSVPPKSPVHLPAAGLPDHH